MRSTLQSTRMLLFTLILLYSVFCSSLAEEPGRIDPATCPPQMDVAFLIDTSGSTEDIYREHVKWTVSLIDALPVHQDAVRTSVLQYAESPTVEFHLSQYSEKDDILKHLEGMKFQSGVTKSGAALRAAEEELFIASNGARQNVSKYVVIFTDGLSIDDPINPSYHLRNDKGVKIYVISVGTTGFVPEMLRIAGEPENVFGPTDLERFKKQLLLDAESSRVCPKDPGIVSTPEEPSQTIGPTINKTSTKFPVLISEPTFSVDYPIEKDSEPLSETITILARSTPNTTSSETSVTDKFNGSSSTNTSSPATKPSISIAKVDVQPKEENILKKVVKANNIGDANAHGDNIKKISTPVRKPLSNLKPVTATKAPQKSQLPQKVRKVKKVRRIIRRIRKRIGGPAKAGPLEGRRKVVRKVVHKSKLAAPLPSKGSNIHRESIIPEVVAAISKDETVTFETIKTRSKPTIRPKTFKITTRQLPAKVEAAKVTVSASVPGSTESHRKNKLITVRPWINPRKLLALPATLKPEEDATTKHSEIQKEHEKTTQKIIIETISEEPTTISTPAPSAKKPEKTKHIARALAVKTAEVESVFACPLDILFIVDSSGSVQSIYDKQKTYLSSLLKAIDPESKSHRVSLIQFSSAKTQKMEWTFDSYSQNEQLMRAFNGVRYFTGTTYIGAALKLALAELETRRQDVPTIVILVSDGFSQDDAIGYSNKINELPNVEFFAVSLAALNNNKYLSKMVESEENVYIGKDAEFFKAKLLERLKCN